MMKVELVDPFFEDVDSAALAQVTQRSLIDTQERLGMMLEIMPVGLIIHTGQGILFANHEACRLLQVSGPQAIGHHFLDFVAEADVGAVGVYLMQSLAALSAPNEIEATLRRADGSLIDVKLISGQLPWEGNPVMQILVRDVTETKLNEQALRRLSITDELTGAFNRRHAFYEASLYIGPDAGRDSSLSVILIDIDHFKRINDQYGHASGDRALVELAQVSKSVLQSLPESQSTMFARIGGEEFLILLPSYSTTAAAAAAERLRSAVSQIRILDGVRDFGFTISLGVATYEPHDASLEGLMSHCDKALYKAKSSGRNRVEVATRL